MRLTLKQLEALQKKGKISGFVEKTAEVLKAKKVGKYNARQVEIDGIKFHSTKEGARYIDLKRMEKAGAISDLKLQVPYELNPGGTHSMKYIADFVYTDKGRQVVEDVKGAITKLYRKKRDLMKKVHSITILET